MDIVVEKAKQDLSKKGFFSRFYMGLVGTYYLTIGKWTSPIKHQNARNIMLHINKK